MSGTRQYRDPDPATVKLTFNLPTDVDRQLRALAALRRVGVGPMIREWLIEKLKETEDAA
jgi:hypothetical protein